MTIAVSSVVKPSKLLLATVATMWFATAAAVGAAALARFGISPLLMRTAIIAGGLFFALSGGFHFARKRVTWRIDVSGAGQIRLSGNEAPDLLANASKSSRKEPELVRLLSDSTLWPNLLLLRLRREDGRIIVLPILPDSVCAEDFRALSAALRWIALRQPDERVKIL